MRPGDPEPPPDDGQAEVAAILEALREEVRAARAAQGDAEAGTALGALERELRHCAEQLEITRVVSAHWPLEGRGLYQRGLFLVHKLVRRYLRWYVNPIVEQQNAFNEAAARSLRLLIEANGELRAQIAELRRAAEAGGPPAGGEPQGLAEHEAGAAPAPPAPDPGLAGPADQAAARAAVSAHWQLGGETPLARARALLQRAVRQYLRWYINPIVEQQNAANAALADALPRLAAADAELRARLAALRAPRRVE